MFERIQHLTSAMAAGNTAAVDVCFNRYFDWMYAHARQFTKRDESFCLDVVQDAAVCVARTVEKVDDESRFHSWLRLVVQTSAFNLLREEAHQKNREAMTAASQLEVSSDSVQLDWLHDQINQQDPELINLIESRFSRNRSVPGVDQVGVSWSNTLNRRLRRALRKLSPSPGESSPMTLQPTVEFDVVEAVLSSPMNAQMLDAGPTLLAEPVQRASSKLTAPAELQQQTGAAAAPVAASMEMLQVFLKPESAVGYEAAVTVASMPVIESVEGSLQELIVLEDEAGAYDDWL